MAFFESFIHLGKGCGRSQNGSGGQAGLPPVPAPEGASCWIERSRPMWAGLTGRDQNAAYASLQALEAECADSDGVYPYFDDFAAMLGAESGFVRIRGLRLLAALSRWDDQGKTAAVLPEVLRRITDPKPIIARQCIQCLPALGAARPELAPPIRAALEAADFSAYADSMAPLLEKDRAAALLRLRDD